MTYLAFGGGGGVIWIVARDSRDAQSWFSLPFSATDERACHAPMSLGCPLLEFGCK